jgi:phosphoribosylpyrophosphate synthetase
MKVISKQVKSKNIINEFFTKTTIEEIVDDDLIDKYQIQKDYPNDFNKVIFEIHRSFRRMKGKFFEAKYVDKKYLKYIKYISLNNDENLRQYIDNKNILLLDDTISSGETISQCINGILSNFMPKSITIITLLSKLK